jgi:chromosome segregation ATPase
LLEENQSQLAGASEQVTDFEERLRAAETEANQRVDALTERVKTLEVAAKVAGEELTRLKAENEALATQMADFNKAVAAEVLKLGLSPKAVEHKEAPAETDLTPTQRVLLAKGVSSLAELSQRR